MKLVSVRAWSYARQRVFRGNEKNDEIRLGFKLRKFVFCRYIYYGYVGYNYEIVILRKTEPKANKESPDIIQI